MVHNFHHLLYLLFVGSNVFQNVPQGEFHIRCKSNSYIANEFVGLHFVCQIFRSEIVRFLEKFQ